MFTEYKLKPRPYSDEEAKKLLSGIMSPETADWHYNTHHKGYITKRNEIEKKLLEGGAKLREGANANYSEYGELKRRETFNASGAILHDIFWDNLGGNGDISNAPKLKQMLERDFGSVDNWKADFKACALAAKNSGWGILAIDSLGSSRLHNFLVDEHHYGAVWGAWPIIAIDVFEHAYYHKDGPARAKYIDSFLANLNFERIEKRLECNCCC